MKFYDREKELSALGNALKQPASSMVIITGRRRIGKSRLVDEFLKTRRGLTSFIVPKEEKQVAADLAEVLADGYKPIFNSVKDAFEYFFTKSKFRLLYVDEFQNFLEVNPSIPFELQRLWDVYKDKTDKVLFFSGSYTGMMDKIFTKQKAPLFNRASLKIVLRPLEQGIIWKIQQESLNILDPVEAIRNYCIFGGIPYYYELMQKQSLRGNIDAVNSFFFGLGQLNDEGQDILRQEFGSAYKKYFSILEAIGYGSVSIGEIAGKIGIAQTTLSKYIMALQRDFKLIRRIVPFGQNPIKSKKGLYLIDDNLLAFWFANVYGKMHPPSSVEIDVFVSKRFELLCADFLSLFLQKNGERILKVNKWWGSVEIEKGEYEQREIDLVIETDSNLYIGECKWSAKSVGAKELERLKKSSKAIKTKKQIKWVLFSRSDFGIKEESDVLLFNAKKIVQEGVAAAFKRK